MCEELLALNERTMISQRLVQNLTKQRAEYETKIEDLQDSLVTERGRFDEAEFRGKELELEVGYLNEVVGDLQPRLARLEAELQVKSIESQHLSTELLAQEETQAALLREKRRLEAAGERLMKQLGEEEDKNSTLNRIRLQLQEGLVVAEEALSAETREKMGLAEALRRQEGEVKKHDHFFRIIFTP